MPSNMKIKPTHQHLLNLIHDVDRFVKMTWLSEGFRSINVQQYLYQWQRRNDVAALDCFGQCMFDSFTLAAARGFSGDPVDTERSIRSLQVNIQYYQVRLEARRPAFCDQNEHSDPVESTVIESPTLRNAALPA
jgi:hypothetical protein